MNAFQRLIAGFIPPEPLDLDKAHNYVRTMEDRGVTVNHEHVSAFIAGAAAFGHPNLAGSQAKETHAASLNAAAEHRQAAENTVEGAKAVAHEIMAGAQKRAEQILSEARQRSDDTVADAKTEANSLESQAAEHDKKAAAAKKVAELF